MPQPIYLPKDRSPFESLLPMVQQMFMMKFHHKMDMDLMDAETKRRSAEKAEQRGYQEKTQLGKEKRGEQTQIRKEQRVIPKTSVQRKSRIFVKNGKIYKQDYNFDPNKGTETNVGKSYESSLPGMPFAQKVALKKTTTPTAEANLKLSKERLELSKQQKTVQMQGRAIEAEQQILGNPKDPRAPTAVRQFQQNAGTQAYMYISKERTGWFGGKTTEAEKIQLPANPQGKQVTAKDVMDTLKANPTKFRTVEDVLKAIGAM